MNLSSCRELKNQLLRRAYDLPGETRHLRSYHLPKAARVAAKRRGVEASESTSVAALGVAPAGKKDFKLAVRIFKGQEHRESQLLGGLGRHAKEMDIARGVRYKPRAGITVRAGGSCGHYKITAGTLGGFVEDASGYYMMSNNHVFANSNQCFGADPVLQPGPLDITGSFHTIGLLERWFPLSKSGSTSLDVAIASFTDQVGFFEPWRYAGVGTIKKQPASNRFSVTRVIKLGRTTGIRRGTVSAFELDGVQIDYGTPSDPAIVSYDDQIEVIGDPPSRAFSDAGDSGSFIIDRDTMEVYALLYGGGPDSTGIDRTLAQFMPDVFKAMKVTLVQ
ncbi:MAG TPA: hypothetical protein VFS12_06280 [Terriglobia bacterium]|nr:hypothetical protein [Terriglobia bacterium]